MSQQRIPVLALLILLPLAGCAGGVAAPAAPPAASTSAASPTRAATPTAAADRPSAPVVPTTRATLGSVAAEPEPTRFAAGSVGIDLPVKSYGVDDAGFMLLPETVDQVAWYAYSARPGDGAGTTVLAAHVDTAAEGLGPFARLEDLREGDDLSLTDADDRVRSYVVTSVEEVDKAEVPLDRVFRRDGEPELKVITCGGRFDRRTGYSDNVIVSARPR